MRAIVLLCLLHGAFGQNPFNWNDPGSTNPRDQPYVCLADQATCGCCLMQKQIQRMESFFNMGVEELNKNLTNSKTALNNIRASRSAFSVALNNNVVLTCFGPFATNKIIIYQHVFLNLGGGYDVQTGVFTAPRSGVYSIAVTIYSNGNLANHLDLSANLEVNGKVVGSLREKKSPDLEDSATMVMAVKLKAGDELAVVLSKGCLICDNRSHYNTFTGFLLYPC
ncbi:complement C1q-like protein 2 [Anoplopoma fimbria]|uniref:complement C1q-like protein 2 n=1 Tax=Anoplopoma fimbria TaxID=229290 RepID=UPI0023EA9249|nr:complement C1q-like protein 2 [Anoplopoma fimbria]